MNPKETKPSVTKGQALRVAFMGTPEFAVPALEAIVKAGHNVVCVYTQPPRPAGRGQQPRKSAVHVKAEELGIDVRTPQSLRRDDQARQDFKDLNLDIAVVAAFGQILPQEILDMPQLGCWNIHASLLPRWRGAAPIQRALLAGDLETGICIMQMEAGLDTGAVLLSQSTPLDPSTTASNLHDTLACIGAELIVKALDDPNNLTPVAQDDRQSTYAAMLTKDDGRIDWTKPATEIERAARALTPWPGLWFQHAGKRVKVLTVRLIDSSGAAGEILDKNLTVACGADALVLETVQPENRKAMSGAAFLNGGFAKVGDLFS